MSGHHSPQWHGHGARPLRALDCFETAKAFFFVKIPIGGCHRGARPAAARRTRSPSVTTGPEGQEFAHA